MNFELGEVLGIAITAISTGVAGVVAWNRSRRVSDARAANDIAQENTDRAIHDGHGDEIKSLRNRIDVLDASVVSLNILVQEQGRTIARLEAKLIGIAGHFGNMFFCDECRAKNLVFINAIEKALAEALAEMEHRK